MAAQKREINLLPREDWEKKPIGRIVKWTLTFGRYIVIATELIVIIAFITRFRLDRNLNNLYEEIGYRQEEIKAEEEFEETLRSTQDSLRVIRELEERRMAAPEILEQLAFLIPLNVRLSNLGFDGKTVSVKGVALSESGLALLVVNFQRSEYFKNIRLGKIARGNRLEIDFEITAEIDEPALKAMRLKKE